MNECIHYDPQYCECRDCCECELNSTAETEEGDDTDVV